MILRIRSRWRDNPGGTGITNYSARAVDTLYVINDIADKYGLIANNGGGTDGSNSLLNLQLLEAFLVQVEIVLKQLHTMVLILTIMLEVVSSFNGDDAIELFYDGLIDVMVMRKWFRLGLSDWAHRNGKTLSPRQCKRLGNQRYKCKDDFYTNALNTTKPYPLATYSAKASPTSVFLGAASGSVFRGRWNI